MKNFSLLLALLMSNWLIAQTCLSEGITFITQTQIDNFSINYGTCTTIEGDVTISGDIENLRGLDQLEQISGNLTITNNDGLEDLTGLDNLYFIGGSLEISFNDDLESLAGLDALADIGGSFTLKDNDALLSLTGLEALSTIGGDFMITKNDVLASVVALSNLGSIGGVLEVSFSDALASLEGLDNIDPGSIDNLILKKSQVLTYCEVGSLCDYLSDPTNPATIEKNMGGCNTRAEVEEACSLVLPVSWETPVRARMQNYKALIDWSVSHQVNNLKFIIRHSQDGENFIAIGEIKGETLFLPEKAYQFIHETPGIGENYYQVIQVGLDGNRSYSNIAAADNTVGFMDFYPNPTENKVFLTTERNTRLLIYNDLGRMMKEIEISAGTNQIDLENMKPGIYIFRFQTGEVKRLIKI